MSADSPSPPAGARMGRPILLALVVALLGILLIAIPRIGTEPAASPFPLPSVSHGATILLAGGDIGFCDGTHDEDVAALAASLPGTIALLGDLAYPDGSTTDYSRCFAPAWTPLLSRIRPAPGNHEYATRNAVPYFTFFGASAGPSGPGWYSYDLGTWHIVALNSNCYAVGGCGPDSAQFAWLKLDLAAAGSSRPGACTLAYWHHPRYSSGLHGDDQEMQRIWAELASAGADIVLSGHDHDYERFAPIDGIRQFVVGTGGRSLYAMVRAPEPGSEIRNNTSYGLLMLTLGASDYTWRFIPAAGSTFTDSGSGSCR